MKRSRHHVRPYNRADAQAVVDVINAASAREPGFRRAAVDAVGEVRYHRYVPPSADKVVACTDTTEVIGFAYVADKEHSIVLETGGAVRPEHWGQGVGTALIQWAEERALAVSNRAPAGVRTVLQVNLFENETAAIRLFSDAGYVEVREWTHMELQMEQPFPPPMLTDGLVLREMDLENDWDIVGPAMEDAFTDHWGAIPFSELEQEQEVEEEPSGQEAPDSPIDDSYSNAPGYCFMALDGDTVAGGILCNARLVERNDTGRVGSVFVRRAYRRRRIGHALMQTAINAFWKSGVRRVVLDTDSESFSQSAKFYSGLGMKPYRREFLFEKEIRPGRDVRRLVM